ncbi:MAG: penicillin-binding protein 2 [Fibrobacteres bacterium]|nr:penicillin-binding protein 2 [Fibrobacterota bacterium]
MNDARLRMVRLGFTLLFALIAVRLFWIQVVQAPGLRAKAHAQSRMRQILSAPRGEIVDCDGAVLAADGAAGREWPSGPVALPLLGMVGRDGTGLMGLEYSFDKDLRSVPGWKVARRTARGGAWPSFDGEGSGPRQGLTVVTTLRLGLQSEVEKILAEAVEAHDAKGGVVLVMEAATGDVVAAASLPSPASRADMARGRVDAGLVHRTYEPGSTFKAITLASALENRQVTLDSKFTIGASFDPGDGSSPIRDSHAHPGTFSALWCFQQSSNVCFSLIAQRVGQERLYRTARDLGFGTPSGLGLPGEEAGILRTVDNWTPRTLPTLAIGQEVTVTPMQLASAYAAMANKGVLMKPRLVKALVDGHGDTVERIEPRPVRQAISEHTASEVLRAMAMVVDSGTGSLAAVPGLRILGKTGTSQKVDVATNKYFQDRFMASFIGIIDLGRRPVVCLVVLDDPTRAGHTGGLAAAPAFARIARFAVDDPTGPWGAGAIDRQGALQSWISREHKPKTDSVPLAIEKAGSEAPG